MPKKLLEIQSNFIIKSKVVKKKNSGLEIEDSIDVKNKFMTYFLLFFPTVILIAIPCIINGSIVLSVSLKVLIAFYQFVTLKTFVDKHYE